MSLTSFTLIRSISCPLLFSCQHAEDKHLAPATSPSELQRIVNHAIDLIMPSTVNPPTNTSAIEDQ